VSTDNFIGKRVMLIIIRGNKIMSLLLTMMGTYKNRFVCIVVVVLFANK